MAELNHWIIFVIFLVSIREYSILCKKALDNYTSTKNPRDKHIPFLALEKENPKLRRRILFFCFTTIVSLIGLIISTIMYIIHVII